MLIGCLLTTGGVITVVLALTRPEDATDLGRPNAILVGVIFFGCGLGLAAIGRLNLRS